VIGSSRIELSSNQTRGRPIEEVLYVYSSSKEKSVCRVDLLDCFLSTNFIERTDLWNKGLNHTSTLLGGICKGSMNRLITFLDLHFHTITNLQGLSTCHLELVYLRQQKVYGPYTLSEYRLPGARQRSLPDVPISLPLYRIICFCVSSRGADPTDNLTVLDKDAGVRIHNQQFRQGANVSRKKWLVSVLEVTIHLGCHCLLSLSTLSSSWQWWEKDDDSSSCPKVGLTRWLAQRKEWSWES